MAVLPPPQPSEANITPNIARKTKAVRALANARRLGCGFELRLGPKTNKKSRITPTVSPGASRSPENGVERGALEKGTAACDPPLVITDTIKGAALPFEICSVDGPCMVAPRGAPLYVKEIVPL